MSTFDNAYISLCVFINHLLHSGTVLGARDRAENVSYQPKASQSLGPMASIHGY